MRELQELETLTRGVLYTLSTWRQAGNASRYLEKSAHRLLHKLITKRQEVVLIELTQVNTDLGEVA